MLRKAIAKDKETLEVKYRSDWTSLGIIEIELIDLHARPPRTNWKRAKAYMHQANLFIDKKPLEQPPIELKLVFRCKNNPACPTHSSRLIAWEYMEAFRNFRRKYGSGIAAFGRIRDATIERFSDPKIKAYALIGTHHRYPVWMVGQLYFIERSVADTQRLF